MEQKFNGDPPESFAIIFDSWTTSGIHHTSLYATSQSNKNFGCERILLARSPIDDETS